MSHSSHVVCGVTYDGVKLRTTFLQPTLFLHGTTGDSGQSSRRVCAVVVVEVMFAVQWSVTRVGDTETKAKGSARHERVYVYFTGRGGWMQSHRAAGREMTSTHGWLIHILTAMPGGPSLAGEARGRDPGKMTAWCRAGRGSDWSSRFLTFLPRAGLDLSMAGTFSWPSG